MFSLKSFKLSFLLFSAILYTRVVDSNLKKKSDQLDKLLTNPGWKNLNDVYCITYCKKKYHLKSLIEVPTSYILRDPKIRALAVYLGCTYTKVLKCLSYIISNVLQNCNQKFKENDINNGCICTEELVYIISMLFVPMVTLMKDAMHTIDLLHTNPWARCERLNYIVIPLYGRIQNILDRLSKPTLSRNDIYTYTWTLDIINTFFENIINSVIDDAEQHCEYYPYDTNYLWKEWVNDYIDIVVGKDVKLSFFKFVTEKAKNYISTVIIEKYFQLGFKFDPITEETFLPTADELNEIDLECKATKKVLLIPMQIENH
ncbi:uncharacterized protein LOC126907682 [Daktulosphaira vitifoliae]|uniref:uncharacterized protein LOC126907682 n=1 Tax=Daktulosphaira vitifoliae TaxID=58002 RepID=UPI0021A9A2D3|nr:uncharacterized protein LOC126907682 [Daktulosphaira vitifoliae]